MKTNELTGAALDWAVAKCEGEIWEGDWYARHTCRFKRGVFGVCLADGTTFSPSTYWAQGGPLIEGIEFRKAGKGMWASYPGKETVWGETHLIAAMRCYVASKLGDEVEIPKELTE